VAAQALAEAGVGQGRVGLVGVTQGPGLVGALLIGLATAKAFAFALDVPLVGVNHIHAHICANYIEHRELEPPFLALVVSGGHTDIVVVEGYNDCRVVGRTRDDAAGEAFDKAARALGLGYPGGPEIDRAAGAGNPRAVDFKRALLEKGSLDFSFSGVKTGVLSHINTERQAGRAVNVADVAASFQQSVVDVIVAKAMLAAEMFNEKRIAMAGGVAANSRLRKAMGEACAAKGVELCCPSPALCTDNAAMVGAAAFYRYVELGPDGLGLDACPSLPLEGGQA
jgi:N6-L-threonylcarbamoyladenine synthase